MNAQGKPKLSSLSEENLEKRKRHADFLWLVLGGDDDTLSSDPVGEGWWPLPNLEESKAC